MFKIQSILPSQGFGEISEIFILTMQSTEGSRWGLSLHSLQLSEINCRFSISGEIVKYTLEKNGNKTFQVRYFNNWI